MRCWIFSVGNALALALIIGDDGRAPNRFAFMRQWYASVVALGLHAVVFHDGLSEQFIATVGTPLISFVAVALNGR